MRGGGKQGELGLFLCFSISDETLASMYVKPSDNLSKQGADRELEMLQLYSMSNICNQLHAGEKSKITEYVTSMSIYCIGIQVFNNLYFITPRASPNLLLCHD